MTDQDIKSVAEELSERHCDDYIDDETQPQCLRAFLDYARSPAHGAFSDGPKPILYAYHKGKRVRVTMASRFGDVGITPSLHQDYGYRDRVMLSELSDFSTRRKPYLQEQSNDTN